MMNTQHQIVARIKWGCSQNREMYYQQIKIQQAIKWLTVNRLQVINVNIVSPHCVRIEVLGSFNALQVALRTTQDPLYGRVFNGKEYFNLYEFMIPDNESITVHFRRKQ
ncbi:hypothetical protein [Actinobacillus delphinicola]|uniref:Uncharacterized protein n=1 Tax=Actinobacillus delphinicola TaxID=51161 RepID=A0A448TUW6_9PAST|nr:hypothetical protein [Actinobacillus delphinicola]VEJ09725.1 Uncharacterised protein [Actinobacillus delphinicola]